MCYKFKLYLVKLASNQVQKPNSVERQWFLQTAVFHVYCILLRKGGNIYKHSYNSNRQQSPSKKQNIFFPILIYKIDLFLICNWIPIKQLLYS
jgi:hypothetical protein